MPLRIKDTNKHQGKKYINSRIYSSYLYAENKENLSSLPRQTLESVLDIHRNNVHTNYIKTKFIFNETSAWRCYFVPRLMSVFSPVFSWTSLTCDRKTSVPSIPRRDEIAFPDPSRTIIRPPWKGGSVHHAKQDTPTSSILLYSAPGPDAKWVQWGRGYRKLHSVLAFLNHAVMRPFSLKLQNRPKQISLN